MPQLMYFLKLNGVMTGMKGQVLKHLQQNYC